MLYVFLAISLLGAVGLGLGWQLRRKHDKRAITIVIAGFTATLGGGVGVLLSTQGKGENHYREETVTRESGYLRVAMRKLGLHFAKDYEGKNVVIILPFPFHQTREGQRAMVEGLERTLSGTTLSIVQPKLPPALSGSNKGPSEGDNPPLETWFDARYMDRVLLDSAREADLVISLIGLPHDFEKMTFWKAKQRPQFATWRGPIKAMRPYLMRGDIAAIVDFAPEPVYERAPVPSDLDEAFNKRYVLLTPKSPAP